MSSGFEDREGRLGFPVQLRPLRSNAKRQIGDETQRRVKYKRAAIFVLCELDVNINPSLMGARIIIIQLSEREPPILKTDPLCKKSEGKSAGKKELRVTCPSPRI